MSCTLTRDDVSDVVVGVLREIHSDPSITEFSRFGIELLVDPFARSTLYPGPISTRIRERGCFLRVFGPTDCQRAQDVEDIVTAAWVDVKSSQRAAAGVAPMSAAVATPPCVVVVPAAAAIVSRSRAPKKRERKRPAPPRAKNSRSREKKRSG